MVGGSAVARCVTWAYLLDRKGPAEESGLALYSKLEARRIGVLRVEHCRCLLYDPRETLVRHQERFASLSPEMADLSRHN